MDLWSPRTLPAPPVWVSAGETHNVKVLGKLPKATRMDKSVIIVLPSQDNGSLTPGHTTAP